MNPQRDHRDQFILGGYAHPGSGSSQPPCFAQAKGKGKMLATMQAYAVKLAVIFVPLPPPLGVIIEKGASLGEPTYWYGLPLRLNV